MMITKRLQKLSAMIIFNSNYLWTYLDWIANMKKTFQFYKAKAGKSSIREQNILAASLENILFSIRQLRDLIKVKE